MQRVRLYHASLAVLAILAYLTGEAGLIHAWLGYGVAGLILLRLIWALGGQRQFGLAKYYPRFDGLRLGNVMTHPAITRTLLLAIALSLIGATATGISMDRGRAIGLADAGMIATAHADEDEERDRNGHYAGRGEHEKDEDEAMEELHETFSNLMLLFVGLHIAYLIAFKRPLAWYMLFLAPPGRR